MDTMNISLINKTICHISLGENSLTLSLTFLFADLLSKLMFSKKIFWNTIRVSISLDPDQVRYFVRPNLGPNCLQRLPVDDTARADKELKPK